MGGRRIVVVAGSLLAACGGNDGSSPADARIGAEVDAQTATGFVGELDQPIPIVLDHDVPQLPIAIGATAGAVLLDTGSPLVELDTGTFALSDGLGEAELGAFGGVFHHQQVVGVPFGGFGGLLGPAALGDHAIVIDYGAALTYLDAGGVSGLPAAIPTAGLDTPLTAPIDLRGGGTVLLPPPCGTRCTVTVGPTRVVVPVVVEGSAPVAMMIDTGASTVTLDPRFAATLADNGRPHLDGVTVNTSSGQATGFFTRVATIAIGSAATDDQTPTLVLSTGDIFDALSAEAGVTISGLVGGSFLRHGVVSIDYPSATVTFARRTDQSYIDTHAFIGPGFDLVPAGPDWLIATVYPATPAAAAGAQVADIVAAIDGVSLTGKSGAEVHAIVASWTVDEVLTVDLERGGTPLQITVTVADLLPPIP